MHSSILGGFGHSLHTVDPSLLVLQQTPGFPLQPARGGSWTQHRTLIFCGRGSDFGDECSFLRENDLASRLRRCGRGRGSRCRNVSVGRPPVRTRSSGECRGPPSPSRAGARCQGCLTRFTFSPEVGSWLVTSRRSNGRTLHLDRANEILDIVAFASEQK